MGILGSLLGTLASGVSQQLWPEYQRACNLDGRTLEAYINNETSNVRKAYYLLALAKKNPSKAKSIYGDERNHYNTAFSNLGKYDRFQQEIDKFIRYCNNPY